MANDSLSRFLRQSNKVDGQSLSTLLAVTNLVTGNTAQLNESSGKLLSPGAPKDQRPLSLNAKQSVTGLQFGRAPGSAVTSHSTGIQWTSLLKQTVGGGGIAGILSGGFSNLGGIGSIVSGIMSLFGGGKKDLPALTPFTLPDSQEHVASFGSAVTQQGSSAGQPTSSASTGSPQGGHVPPASSSNLDAQWFLDNSSNIAQAVKTAMLNSHSINDVIAEV